MALAAGSTSSSSKGVSDGLAGGHRARDLGAGRARSLDAPPARTRRAAQAADRGGARAGAAASGGRAVRGRGSPHHLRDPHRRTDDCRASRRADPDAEPAAITPAPPQPLPAPPRPPPVATPPHQHALTRATMEKWLAERGLAWIGGSALVIGGAFLVGYAAQAGFFGPAMRLTAAIALGLALLGAGEAIRRGRLAGFGGHKLAAAVASGSGARCSTARSGRLPPLPLHRRRPLLGPAGGDRLGPAGPRLPAWGGAGGAGAGRRVRRAAAGRRRQLDVRLAHPLPGHPGRGRLYDRLAAALGAGGLDQPRRRGDLVGAGGGAAGRDEVVAARPGAAGGHRGARLARAAHAAPRDRPRRGDRRLAGGLRRHGGGRRPQPPCASSR